MQARGRGPSFTVVSVSVMGDGLDKVRTVAGAFREGSRDVGGSTYSSVVGSEIPHLLIKGGMDMQRVKVCCG